ncbi:MAG: hypothetical protein JRG67_02085 [Deltaproteobacteria bacterium]|nr:hypothetical protein [Deltaproteobacteria bacterium]MBW1874810.1 hypothetical protein [Deltaproteobacteria bacterium]MBW2209823.1 hypothetical protein [Deltaproteobacteria bacterium]MBW2214823.1 hypothetical protein [Deltaproteobacteria bacterium]MBW2378688.1 hypothetical protein [Deltaproteobacteria bacterium]
MTLNFFGRLTTAAFLLLLSAGCVDSTGDGGAAGSGGVGGAALPSAQIPGLWQGKANGVDVCFYIDDDGQKLEANAMCSVTGTGQPDEVPRSFDLSVDLVGTDENGAPCSFDLSFEADVGIDPVTNAFRAGSAERAFSGEIMGDQASGVASMQRDGSTCRVGWAATKSTQCDDAAIQSCLDLLDCCRAILVSPVFFESCNSVVLQCDQAQCLRVLAGYPQCEPEAEVDAGTPDGG